METRPPVLIETVVKLLVPPAAREHVLGDLAERYSSPRQYVVDAIRAIPFVVVSQIRRTTNLALLAIPAFLFMVSFGAGSPEHFWIRGGVPTIVALVGLVLRDAYRVPDVSRPWRQGLVDMGIVAACVLTSQAVLAVVQPAWLMAPGGLVRSAVVFGLLYCVRVQNPAGVQPMRVAPPGTMSLDDLRHEIGLYEQGTRRAIGIEMAVAVPLMLFFARIALFAGDAPISFRIGCAVGAAGAFFVVSRMWPRWRQPPAPADRGFADTVAHYRARLEHQQHSLQTMWLWYGLPLSAGPTVVLLGIALRSAQPGLAAAGVLLAALLIGIFFYRAIFARMARSLRQRIDALDTVKEQS